MPLVSFYFLLLGGPAALLVAGALAGFTYFVRRRTGASLSVVLIAVNFTAALLYVAIASRVWPQHIVEPAEYFPVGEAAFWFLYAVPVAVVCWIADVLVLGLTLSRYFRSKTWDLSYYAILVPIVWAISISYEASHR